MSPQQPRSPARNRFIDFIRNQRGSISVMTVVTMMPFVIVAGAAIDMGRINRTLGHMQKAVDTAAIAGAATKGPITIADGASLSGDDARIHAANMMVEANLPQEIKTTAEDPAVTVNGNEVVVDLDAEMPTAFMKFVGIETVSLSVSATASAPVDAQACILALGPDGDGIEVGGTVDLLLEGCWLYSNKEGDKSIDVIGTATIDAGGSCSAGSTSVSNNATVYEHRQTNCDVLTDPMAEWMHPDVPESCSYTNFSQNASTIKSIVLSPGLYCGGLQLSGYDYVDLTPGIYYISGGPLTINSKVELTGEDIGFYLANDVTSVTINGTATVSLSASDEGEMDGLLFAMEPGADDLITAKINGGSELGLAGTIYLPTAELEISGNSTTLSTATQIIAHSVKLSGTSSLSFAAEFDEAGFPIRGEFVSTVKLIK